MDHIGKSFTYLSCEYPIFELNEFVVVHLAVLVGVGGVVFEARIFWRHHSDLDDDDDDAVATFLDFILKKGN